MHTEDDVHDEPARRATAAVRTTPFGASLLTLLGAAVGTLRGNVNVVKLSYLVGTDALHGKSPVEAIQDVLDHADDVFPDPATRPVLVQVLGAALYLAKLLPGGAATQTVA